MRVPSGGVRFWLPVLLILLARVAAAGGPEVVPYSVFKQKLRAGAIRSVQLDKNLYVGRPGPVEAVAIADPALLPLLDSLGIEYAARRPGPSSAFSLLFWMVSLGLAWLTLRSIGGRLGGAAQGMLSVGRSRAHVVSEEDVRVTFDDVAGVDEAKEELHEVIDFLKQPSKYAVVGGRIPRGILLVGPPGTGKTLLARAVAGEAKVPFFQISGAEFVEMFVGVGAARVRDMFAKARAQAPSIVFIDELDAIGKSRSAGPIGNDEREQTLNQLLVEMQGFEPQSGVIVLAATNRPDVLDPALLRPGRFDRHILVDRPDLDGREAILARHARKVALDPAVELRQVARKTSGFVGADLANIVNESALLAVRAGRDKVLPEDLDEAIEKAVSGLKKKGRLISPKEKRIVAYHESGHALVAELTPGADRVEKVSLIPRGFGALGFTQQTPIEDRYLLTESELLAKVDVALGGRAAEKAVFGEVSTGAANDLTQATDIARRMLMEFGMSERFRDVALHATRTDPIRREFVEPSFQREYAEATQQYVDEEVARILRERGDKVRALIEANRDCLDRAAQELLRKESLPGEEFRALLRPAEARGPAVTPVR